MTDEDREAAADLADTTYGIRIGTLIRTGQWDDHKYPERFKAHRIQATATLQAENASLKAELAEAREAIDDSFAQMVATFANPDRLKNSTFAMDAFCDAIEKCRAYLVTGGRNDR